MDKPAIVIGIKSGDDDSEGINVPAPDGFEWPKGVDPKEGDRFMCSIKQGPDGQLTIMDIDGLPLGNSEDQSSDDSTEEPDTAMGMFAKARNSLRNA
jgi:hypothetical protein